MNRAALPPLPLQHLPSYQFHHHFPTQPPAVPPSTSPPLPSPSHVSPATSPDLAHQQQDGIGVVLSPKSVSLLSQLASPPSSPKLTSISPAANLSQTNPADAPPFQPRSRSPYDGSVPAVQGINVGVGGILDAGDEDDTRDFSISGFGEEIGFDTNYDDAEDRFQQMSLFSENKQKGTISYAEQSQSQFYDFSQFDPDNQFYLENQASQPLSGSSRIYNPISTAPQPSTNGLFLPSPSPPKQYIFPPPIQIPYSSSTPPMPDSPLLSSIQPQAVPYTPIPFQKRPDCMFFIRGPCSKGTNCIFRHSDKAKFGSHEVCPTWEQQAMCSDPTCVHLHPKLVLQSSKGSQQPLVIVSDVHVIPWSRRPDCMYFINSGQCTKGDRCTFRHNEKARQGPMELCEQWEVGGTCSDKMCSFLHPKKTSQQQNPQYSLNGPQRSSQQLSLPLNLPLPTPNAPAPTPAPSNSPVLPKVYSPSLSGSKSLPSLPDSSPTLTAIQAPTALHTLSAKPLNNSQTKQQVRSPGATPPRTSQTPPSPSLQPLLQLSPLAHQAVTILQSVPSLSMRSTSLAYQCSSGTPPTTNISPSTITTELSKYPAYFLLSDTTPPYVWLLPEGGATNTIKALHDIYVILKYVPTHSMSASILAFFVKIPPNFSVLDIARSHPEMFTTNSSIPLLIQLENEFDGDSTVTESDPAKATLTNTDHKSLSSITHVLEMYNFNPHKVHTSHLEDFLKPYVDSLNARIKWIDDGHALAIFCDSDLAQKVLLDHSSIASTPTIKLRTLSEACPASRIAASKEEWGQPVQAPEIIFYGKTSNSVTISLASKTADAIIWYSVVNDNTPLTEEISTRYNGPFSAVITPTLRVFARATRRGMTESKTVSANFLADGTSLENRQSAALTAAEVKPVKLDPSAPLPPTSPTLQAGSLASASLTATESIKPVAFISPHDLLLTEASFATGYGTKTYGTLKGEPVAVLNINAPHSSLGQLQSELSNFSHLRHPNLDGIAGICVGVGVLSLVSLVPCRPCSLHQLLTNLGPAVRKGQGTFDKFALCIAQGMGYLHRNNTHHLQLSPHSILVCEGALLGSSCTCPRDASPCRITGYGIAKAAMILGMIPQYSSQESPAYYAPELLCGKPQISNAADVYSFGIVLWHICSGSAEPPYRTDNPAQIIAQVIQGKRPKIQPTIPYGWAKLMQLCWAAEPTARPTFDIVLNKLEKLIKLNE
ncbi:Serine/threonine-protein kinase STY46 [Pelomyxa schiedti]|nr:Serine/threonine-protein kinase STY46 [Pelomyxa schiedti]